MITTACNKWSGLFSVGEEFGDEDLLEADWIQISEPASVSGPVPAPLQDLTTSHDAQKGTSALQNRAVVPESSAPASLPKASPAKHVESLSTCGSTPAFSSVPRVPAASLRAPLSGCDAPAAVCPGPQRDPPVQDDFDDWDVDLEELDEGVLQTPGWAQPNSRPALPPDTISPAKRMRSSTGGSTLPQCGHLRAPAFGSHTVAPPRSPALSCGRGASGRPGTLGPVGAPPPGQRGAVTPQLPRHRPASLFQAISPAPLPTLMPHPLHTPVLTNHLVQLVSAANKTPQRPWSDAVRTKTRRFPGPAGVLPHQLSGRSLDDIVVTVPQTPTHGAVARLQSEVPSSQVSEEEEFSGGTWAAMKVEMGLDERNPRCFLHSYSIVMVLRKAALRQLPKNKVPNMAVVLKNITHTHADARAVFRDPTGEMQGTVHRRLLEDRHGELKTGAVLLLKQVGVFSPSHRNHYLNVTPNNLLRIYPADRALPSSHFTQSVLESAGLLQQESSRPAGGPVSQMELYYDDDEEEEEDELTTVPVNTTVHTSSGPKDPDQTLWGADDLDELLWELPVESYST